MRSTQAKGKWSFLTGSNQRRTKLLILAFAKKHGLHIFKISTPGNHIHIHLKLSKVPNFKPFIRAIASAIAMKITGASRLKRLAKKFWDRPPYTRVIENAVDSGNVSNYVELNQVEEYGFSRAAARAILAEERRRKQNRSRPLH